MSIITTCSIPPPIIQCFNRKLLSSAGYKLYSDIFNELLVKFMRKYKNCQGITRDINNITLVEKAIYGWFETYEINSRTTNEKAEAVPPIPTDAIDLLNGRFGGNHIREVLELFQYKALSGNFHHDKVPKDWHR